MVGFDQSRNRYRPWMRLTFYLLGFVLLLGLLLQPSEGVPPYFVYLNLLALLTLPFLLAHRPFRDRPPWPGRAGAGGFLASVLVLTFILPSPIYTIEWLARSAGDGIYCAYKWDYRDTWSCWEIKGGLPKLITPGAWAESSIPPNLSPYYY